MKDLLRGLGKTRGFLKNSLSRWLDKNEPFSDEFWEEWEAALIGVDLGAETAAELVEEARTIADRDRIESPSGIREIMKKSLLRAIGEKRRGLPAVDPGKKGPSAVLMIGVNGTGKTTSIAKLAKFIQNRGNTVLLAACDTFRAAAVEQLQVWAARLKVPMVSQEYGSDPAAVAFDAFRSAEARGCDYLIIDTAGRLHTRRGLLEELEKIVRVLKKINPDQPSEVFLTLDATFGQNGLAQAKAFADLLPLTGVILTKLDGTAKGGIVVPVTRRLGIPVVALGVGEGIDDLLEFEPRSFVEALLEE